MGLDLQIHHIGYAVKDIDKAIDSFVFLGYSITEITDDVARNVRIVFAEKDGYCVELISPLHSEKASPIDTILKKNGPIPYHICYAVDNIQNACALLKKEHYHMISEISPAPAISGRNVVFLYNATIGIIELVEKSTQNYQTEK